MAEATRLGLAPKASFGTTWSFDQKVSGGAKSFPGNPDRNNNRGHSSSIRGAGLTRRA